MQNAGFSIPKSNVDNGDRFVAHEISTSILLLAIADGVGSTAKPGYAAEIAISHAVNEVKRNPNISFEKLFSTIKEVLVLKANEVTPPLTLQTTLTVCIVENGSARVGHVGDTRLYHLRNNGLVTRTEDQTELKKLIDEGVISPVRAKKYPRRNVLLSVLASNRDYDLFESDFDVLRADRLVLASDGFYKVISKKKIIELSKESVSVALLSSSLHSIVVNSDLSDDCSCLIAEI